MWASLLVDDYHYVTNWLLLVLFVLFVKYHWDKRKMYKLSTQLPGPLALPLLGNMYMFIGKDAQGLTELFHECMVKYQQEKKPVRLWLGNYLIILPSTPDDIQIILNSPESMEKIPELYSVLKDFFDDTLLYSPVSQWRPMRKSLSGPFSKISCENYIEGIDKKCRKYISLFENKSVWLESELEHIAVGISLDCILETFTKTNIMTMNDISDITKMLKRINYLAFYRLQWIWYAKDYIFKLSSKSKEFYDIVKRKTEIINKIVEARKNDLKTETSNGTQVKEKCFLDLLIDLEDEGQIKRIDTENHLSFNNASAESSGSLIHYVLLLLAMHPESQEKVREEIDSIFGDSDRPVTASDVREMVYLEMVLKESLRVFTEFIVIGRMVTKDLKLTKCTLPPRTICAIPIYAIHRNPLIWPEPEKFDPDRFLPENCTKRHKYSFIAFSGGPRNCLGEKAAMTIVKTVIANIIRSYSLHTTAKMSDVTCSFAIVTKWKCNHPITITPRNKTK